MKMRKCPKCGRYTLKDFCILCSEKTILPMPAKFSPQDKYGKYRRQMKKYLTQ